MPSFKQIFQAIVGLLLLAIFLYVAAHLLVVAIFLAIGAVAIIWARRFLIEQGIIKSDKPLDPHDVTAQVNPNAPTIEGDYKDVSTDDDTPKTD